MGHIESRTLRYVHAEALARLEFGGQKFGNGDIVKMLGNDGAARSWSSAARSSARTISSRSWAKKARRRRCKLC
ncbi:hypothetical protein AJ88_22245 [Mesorhizobium amorphae CCBAU 01583]|nr:hypothetical protein AJ88_22245 [Mesorhizobium amorphae CCBAU 01583]